MPFAGTTPKASCAALPFLASVLFLFIVPALQAGTIYYSYIDERGNAVYTDALETIPERYRAKVATHERPDPKPLTAMQSLQERIKGKTQQVGAKLSSFHIRVNGLNAEQSRILTYAGAAAIALLVLMYLSKSQLVRMLGFCLLIVVGIGAPVLMYVSDGGPMEVMKQKATAAGQAQHHRMEQIPR